MSARADPEVRFGLLFGFVLFMAGLHVGVFLGVGAVVLYTFLGK